MSKRPHLLILGGTAEGAALAEALTGPLRVTTALAGRTVDPAPVPGTVRIGGFGGADGLAAWLDANTVDLVVDATHPFAATISANAALACAHAQVPRLRLQRPAWERHRDDRWIEVEDVAGAASALAQRGGRAFVTIGVQGLAGFAGLENLWLLIRLIARPSALPALGSHEIILGRGPFTVADEAALLRQHAISVLVTKASGGASTEAKLIAARAAGLPVIMIRRPPPPAGPLVDSVEAAVQWVLAVLTSGTKQQTRWPTGHSA
jgi:precorrin-6A/cobalt-precorrin-6A reductase